MIYLDYSATTPVDKEVLDTFNKASLEFIGNPNSLHRLGVKSKKLIDSATKQIADLLKINTSEIIYTSGSSESNNLAIKGIALKYQNRGKKIITTELEHSSIYGPLGYLQKLGFEVVFAPLDKFGRVDLEKLESLMDDEVILVTISAVNSELGLTQPILSIGKMLKKYPKCFFHTDMTQSVGKEIFDASILKYVDLASFSAHKIYGLKGIGCLIKKDGISLEPLIHGGKSTTIFRSGTPATSLIASFSKALRLVFQKNTDNYSKILDLNKKIKEHMKKYDDVFINSNEYCIPHILNLSIIGVKPETMLHALEEYDIYISTQSACSSNSSKSKAVYAITNDDLKANSSIRISLSYLTTNSEIEEFFKAFDDCYKKLKLK